MIRITYDAEGDFCVVDGHEEFFERMDQCGMAEVIDARTGRNYYAHEVGDQIYLLNTHAQSALAKLASSLILDIATKSLR
jgi:hypothetical protein